MRVLANLKRPVRKKHYIDFYFIADDSVIFSGWLNSGKWTKKKHDTLRYFLNGRELISNNITYPRPDVEVACNTNYPSCFGFTSAIKIPMDSEEIPCGLKLKYGNTVLDIKTDKNIRVSSLDVIESQMRKNAFLFDEFFSGYRHTLKHTGKHYTNFNPNLSVFKKRRELLATLTEDQLAEYDTIKELDIDWAAFICKNDLTPNEDPIIPLVTRWQSRRFVLDDLDTSFYLECYPDIKAYQVNPVVHYFTYGRDEGRLGRLTEDHIETGSLIHDERKPSIVIVSHESSATGAPLVGLNLCKTLSAEYNIYKIVLRKSVLHEDFSSASIKILSNFDELPDIVLSFLFKKFIGTLEIDAVVCNSVESFRVLKLASEQQLPTISLIHEFSEYTKPRGKIFQTICNADRVVFPSNLLLQSAKKDIKACIGSEVTPSNVTIQPQGALPYIPKSHGELLSIEELQKRLMLDSNTKVVVGAGYIQPRKGVDLFIQAAAFLKEKYGKNFRFLWVGEGFRPETDLNYSIWLQKQIDINDIKEQVCFLDHQKNLDNALSIADVFVLSSRLDPFPNVVIDALRANLPIVCFEGASGCAEFLKENGAQCSVVKYQDTCAMAQSVFNYFSAGEKNEHKVANKKIVDDKLNFSTYSAKISRLINEAKNLTEQRKLVAAKLKDSGFFNSNYYGGQGNFDTSLDFYVKSTSKGIRCGNPRPGFNDLEWIEKNSPVAKNVVPLYQAIVNDEPPITHEVHVIKANSKPCVENKVAVHLHLYYPDVAQQFSEYFNRLPMGFDLFITTISNETHEELKSIFFNCGADNIYFKVVENVGRDVVPFFAALSNDLNSGKYDIVGHFHGKKSLSTDVQLGERWRTYLLDNLIGTTESAHEILSLFNDRDVGLIYAEDKHIMDFGKNREYADKLCSELGISPMESATSFPLGTMFWARPSALEPLWNLSWKKFTPAEPIAYDGTYLHAVERLLPHISKASGFRNLTVYTEGTFW